MSVTHAPAREAVYTNYRLQLPEREVLGTIVVRGGRIAEIDDRVSSVGESGNGALLMPGFVELHTDALESALAPRPGIRWPLASATHYHDRAMAAAGITTACDAISIGDIANRATRTEIFGAMIDELTTALCEDRLAVDHRLHLRCELSGEGLLPMVERFIDHPLLALISVMDHSPGQRQFRRLDKFKEYYSGKHAVGPDDMEAFIQTRLERAAVLAQPNRRAIVALAHDRGIALATHDDTTPEHIHEAIADRAAIAEFPTTLEAARLSHEAGIAVMIGSPNLVLGKSHSGNVAARDLVAAGYADVVSSDYVPQSLLEAVFTIVGETGTPLHQAMRAATIAPARAIGLDRDRGSIEAGKRADFLIVERRGPLPHLTAVYANGRRVA